MRSVLLTLAVLALPACEGFKMRADQGPAVDLPAGAPDRSQKDETRLDGPHVEHRVSDLGPLVGCRPLNLPCLDPAPSSVIEVPAERSAAQAFAQSQAGDTIQIRGLSLAGGWVIPPYVTLRGCAGAKIVEGIKFAGSGGIVEGFEVQGQIVANVTGSYIVRLNRFIGGGKSSEPGVSARSVDALVSSSVVALVERNWFEQRPAGVEARTSYDTGTHAVDLTVRDNIFTGVGAPILLSEGGLVGKIKASIEHNTIHAFAKGVAIYNLDDKPVLSGNIFAQGETGIAASAPYELRYCLAWQLTSLHSTPPLAGAFAVGDPAFVDGAHGDFRLGPASAAIDKVSLGATVPAEDYLGCPRPVAFLSAESKADIGAIEAQR